MSLSLIEIAKQLSPTEMDMVTEKALHSGPFAVELVMFDTQTATKIVEVEYKSGRKEKIRVPIWKTNSL